MLKAVSMVSPSVNEISIKRLTKQVSKFYREAIFMPAPHVINLYDRDCVQRVASDIALLSKDVELYEKIIKLLEVM